MKHPLLAKLEALGRLSESDRALLQRLADDIRSFDARQDIIREGDRPEHVHLIIEGWSIRYEDLPDGKRQITAFLIPGDFCDAHVTLLRKIDHSIGSLGPSRVAFIDRKLMHELTQRPMIARALWWASLVDQGVLRAWIVNMGRRDASVRVSHLVCELHARLRSVGLADDGEFGLPATQQELSDALGLTSIHVNRVLKRLREDGLMTFRHKQIVITDIAKLQRAGGFDPKYLHLADLDERKQAAA